jgi:hypothetical protein
LSSGNRKVSPELSYILEKYGDRNAPALTVDVKDDNQVIDLALD